jgi:hypothetical protein
MDRTTTSTHSSTRPLRHLLRILSVGCLLLSGTAASAQVTTVPSGLNCGDQYRLIFVTSTTRDATSVNMADYNAFVTGVANSQAELAALDTQWYAVGATATTSARTNTGIVAGGDVPVFRLDGQVVVNDAFGLWQTVTTQPLLNPVAVNETGALQTGLDRVFTGSSPNGLPSALALGATNVEFGRFTVMNGNWLFATNDPATDLRPFYAVSATLTVPAGGGSAPNAVELAGNLAPTGTHQIGPAWSVTGANVFSGSISRAASFVPAQDARLESLQLPILGVASVDDVRIELRDDASGAPGGLIEDLGVHSGFPLFGTTTSGQSTFPSVAKPTLLAGTTYWIVCSAAHADTWARWAPNDKGAQGQIGTYSAGSWTVQNGTELALQVDGHFLGAQSYCTAGVSASGCQATLSAPSTACATASSGFVVVATGVEGAKDGVFFYGTNGRQANSWGNGTSYQCVVPPVKRAGLLNGSGTNGTCDGTLSQDLNVLWSLNPLKNPGAGTVVQAQLWYRDPFNTSNQTTSLSNAIEFGVLP